LPSVVFIGEIVVGGLSVKKNKLWNIYVRSTFTTSTSTTTTTTTINKKEQMPYIPLRKTSDRPKGEKYCYG